MKKNIVVFGIFPDQLTAEDGIDSLKDAGFRSDDVSVLFPDYHQRSRLSHRAADAAVAGGSAAVLGGALGWIAGMGALSIPGAGPFIAAGPLMGMLGGMGAGAALGGLTSALASAGIPEDESRRYEGRLQHGSILTSVHCADEEEARRAKIILQGAGAEDVDSAGNMPPQHAASLRPQLV